MSGEPSSLRAQVVPCRLWLLFALALPATLVWGLHGVTPARLLRAPALRPPANNAAGNARIICARSLPAAQLPMANNQPSALLRPVALLFGDSLTERCMDPEGGWGAALAHHYARKLDVVNRGFGGYNTAWGSHLLPLLLKQALDAQQHIALMTIWFGANDAALPGRTGERQHVPLQQYVENLAAMVEAARAAGVQRIVLMTPPPVDDAARVRHVQQRAGTDAPMPPDRTLDASAAYAAAACELARRLEVPVLDLHSALQTRPDWKAELLSDGLHFTPAGARAVWAELQLLLEATYPELRCEETGLEMVSNQMPWWDTWDAADPGAFWDATLPRLREAGLGTLGRTAGGM